MFGRGAEQESSHYCRSGQRYVRVGADILLIAIGTAMVVDAIQELGRS